MELQFTRVHHVLKIKMAAISICKGEITQLQITRAHHVLKIKMAAISICLERKYNCNSPDRTHAEIKLAAISIC